MPMSFTVYFAENYMQEGLEFVDEYEPVRVITVPDRRAGNLRDRKVRICRFCRKRYPAVSFHNDAHIISELLGNRHLISDAECDDCNYKFKKLEDHLANYLGITRTLNQTKGKQGVPIYKSPNKKLRAEKKECAGITSSVTITDNEATGHSLAFDPISGRGHVEAPKHSYRPLWAYKALVKMAISCLDDAEVINYQAAIDYLLSDKLDDAFTGSIQARLYRIPLGYGVREPYALMFKKRDPRKQIATHMFALCWQEVTFEIQVPLHRLDQAFYNGQKFRCYWCPPMFATVEDAATIPVRHFDVSLASKELVKDDKDRYEFTVAPEDLANLMAVNADTGEVIENATFVDGIRKMILVPSGTQFNPTDLSDWIKQTSV